LSRLSAGLSLLSDFLRGLKMSKPTVQRLDAIIDFTGLHPSAQKWTWEEYEEVVKREGLKIFTLEGPLFASIGDYIMRGVNGEFYPIKPDILAKTYDRVG
jgi:preprotein translocase subunit Sss1